MRKYRARLQTCAECAAVQEPRHVHFLGSEKFEITRWTCLIFFRFCAFTWQPAMAFFGVKLVVDRVQLSAMWKQLCVKLLLAGNPNDARNFVADKSR